MEEELIITTEEIHDILLLRLNGDLTKTSGEHLLHYFPWEQGLPNNKSILVISFEKTNYINSAGIAYIIRLCRLLNDNSVIIRAFGLEYQYEKMFHIVGLSKYLTHYPSEWAAMEDLQNE